MGPAPEHSERQRRMSENDPSPQFSVVLPGYNEREGIQAAIDAYLDALPRCGVSDFEIIIIDDGSTDGTGALADQIAREQPRVRVFHHERNLGMMAAVLHGFRQAKGDVVTYNGVDIPFDPLDTGMALEKIREGADVVVIERTNRDCYGPARKVISWANILVLRGLFRTPFWDHNFVQFFRREALASLTVCSRGVSTFSAELIFRARRNGLRVEGRHAAYHERRTGQSTITARKVFHTAWETLRLWWLLRRCD